MRMKRVVALACLLMVLSAGCAGKTASGRAGEPAVTAQSEASVACTEAPDRTASPATPEPTATPAPTPEPTPEPYGDTIDYHRLAPLYEEVYSAEEIALAHEVVDAFLRGETAVPLKTPMRRSEMDHVQVLLRVMCPPFSGLCNVTLSKNYAKSVSAFTWEYRYDAERTEAELAGFEEEVRGYLALLKKGDGEAVRALAIYLKFARATEYDDQLAENDAGGMTEQESSLRSSPYYTILYHTGVCYCYAQALTFLYAQAGLEAGVANCWDGETAGAHAWTLVKLDGHYYYADATWEHDAEFYGTLYFGMTAEDRYQYGGGYAAADTEFCYTPILDHVELTDTRFAALHGAYYQYITAYEVDHQSGQIVFTFVDGSRQAVTP